MVGGRKEKWQKENFLKARTKRKQTIKKMDKKKYNIKKCEILIKNCIRSAIIEFFKNGLGHFDF